MHGILAFISMPMQYTLINTAVEMNIFCDFDVYILKSKTFIDFGYFDIYEQFKFHAQLS